MNFILKGTIVIPINLSVTFTHICGLSLKRAFLNIFCASCGNDAAEFRKRFLNLHELENEAS